MSNAPSQSQDKFIVRLPDGLRERIKLAADLNNRSMNAEIVDALEEKYPPISDDPKLAELHRLLSKYLSDRANFTDEEEFNLNTLIVEFRLPHSGNGPGVALRKG